MFSRIIFQALIITIAIISLSGSGFSQEVITLDDAIRIGLEHNFNIQIARNSSRIALNNSGKGTAAYLPTLTAVASMKKSDTEEESDVPMALGDSETDLTTAQLTLDWTLFDGFQMFAEKRRYSELAQLGQQQARSLIEANVVAINRAYFNLVTQEQLLLVARSAFDISGVRFDKMKVRRELGGASSTDLLNAEVSLNADHANLLNSELAVVIARQALNLLLGRDADTPLEVNKQLTIPELDQSLAELNRLALSHNSNLKVVTAQGRVANAGLVSSRSRFFPRVSLSGTYSLLDRDQYPDIGTARISETTEKSVGLNLVWSLFNGGRDRIDWQNAKVDLNSQQLSLRQHKLQLAGDLREQHETYVRRKELVEIETNNVKAADRNLEILSEKLEIGGVTSLEFRDGQVNLVRAQTGLITARHLALLAHLEIQRLTGSLSIE